MSGDNTCKVNLDGKSMLSGFIDGHSHLLAVAVQVGTANLLPPPDGPGQNIAALQQTLRDFIATSAMVKEHSVVIGFNYDDSQLEEARYSNRHKLGAVSTEMLIMTTHQPGYIDVYNTKTLEMFGISAESVDLTGGIIRRETGTNQLNGVLEKNVHLALVYKRIPTRVYRLISFLADDTTALESLIAFLQTGVMVIDDASSQSNSIKLLASRLGFIKVINLNKDKGASYD
jgi:predicted amidohydrolase YtcJ